MLYEVSDEERVFRRVQDGCCLPEHVRGMPICLESRDFAVDMPSRRFQEKPPLFIVCFPILLNNPCSATLDYS